MNNTCFEHVITSNPFDHLLYDLDRQCFLELAKLILWYSTYLCMFDKHHWCISYKSILDVYFTNVHIKLLLYPSFVVYGNASIVIIK